MGTPAFNPSGSYAPVAFDPSASFEAVQEPSLDLANKQGQGVYQMADQSGKSTAVPYGEVLKAANHGYSFADDATRFRFAKDNAADPNKANHVSMLSSGMTPEQSTARAQAIEQNSSLPMQAIGGIAKGGGTLARPVLDAVALRTGQTPQDVDQMLTPQTTAQKIAKYGTVAAAVAPAAIAAPLATAGGIVGGTIGGMAAGAGGRAMGLTPQQTQLLSDVGGIAGGVGGGMAGNAARPAVAALGGRLYPTSQSLAPQVSTARNLARALVVEPQAAPNFIKAATDEAGTIVGFAKDNNLPINSKVDFANAAKGAAKTVQDHFDALLKPSADTVTAVPASYRGTRVGEGPNATLDAINSRIDAISSELKPNFRKATAAQTSTANTSDADLIAEKQALTNVLHTKLAAATGLTPADIAAIRQQAGKLRTIADEANLSANRDTAAAGKQAMGATTSAVGTKVGMIDRALQAAQGGPEIIGNRQILSALKNVQPAPLNLPMPKTTVAPPISRMDQLLADSKRRFAQQQANSFIDSALKIYPPAQ